MPMACHFLLQGMQHCISLHMLYSRWSCVSARHKTDCLAGKAHLLCKALSVVLMVKSLLLTVERDQAPRPGMVPL